jgi:putative transposase
MACMALKGFLTMSRNTLMKGRSSLKHHIYHITTCTENRQAFFHNVQYARLLINEMTILVAKQEISSNTWVIMPYHLHRLFQLTSDKNLSKVIQILKGRSLRAINRYEKGADFHGAAVFMIT